MSTDPAAHSFRPEEHDLRVLACSAGIDRLSRANLLTPYETTVALKLALRALLLTTRAPIAMLHQVRGMLLELETECAFEIKTTEHGDA